MQNKTPKQSRRLRNSPKIQKIVTKHSNQAIRVVSVSMQGWRPTLEDQIICELDLKDGNSLFAVFDGHNGQQVSRFLANEFKYFLLQNQYYEKKNYEKALKQVFMKVDDFLFTQQGERELHILRKESLGCISYYFDKVKNGRRKIGHLAGSTANVLLLTKSHIYVANSGDSRSILMGKKNYYPLSKDHKPNNAEEKQRIKKNGLQVLMGNRINGELNVSRGFGDFRFKNKGKHPFERAVTCKPDITKLQRRKGDQFILLGCDGFWEMDKLAFEKKNLLKESMETFDTSQGKTSVVLQIKQRLKEKDGETVLKELFDESLAKSKEEKEKIFDNVTAILIQFS